MWVIVTMWRHSCANSMARVGVANYQHSTASPVLQDKYWREGQGESPKWGKVVESPGSKV